MVMSKDLPVPLAPALVVEDDPALQARLQRLLQALSPEAPAAVVAGSLAAARDAAARHAFALALVDIGLPDGSGVTLIAELQASHPATTCVVVSAWGQEDIALQALRAGAIGYLLKERDDAELLHALHSIQRGGAPIDPSIAGRILRTLALDTAPASPPPPSPLSEREHQILTLVARGYSNREIAELTTLSRFTIEDYTKSIYRKLAVGSRTAAVFEAQSKGLLD
jgi:DNA-binding NarL/FixJ family response regulator